MQQSKTNPVEPLARNANVDVLDWQGVDRADTDLTKDVLGLSPQDRQALGMSQPRSFDLHSPALGGAETALADVLARGGAITPGRGRAEPYVPSGAVGQFRSRRKI